MQDDKPLKLDDDSLFQFRAWVCFDCTRAIFVEINKEEPCMICPFCNKSTLLEGHRYLMLRLKEAF